MTAPDAPDIRVEPSLPIAAEAAKFGNYPLSLAFHPKLPRLYVWQEINVPYVNAPAPHPPIINTFDHLCIYDLSQPSPTLMAALCRGPDFGFGLTGGGIAVDADGVFLYVPNVREVRDRNSWSFGRFPLDGDGLPKVHDKEIPLAERLKELVQINEKKPLVPLERAPVEPIYIMPSTSEGSVTDIHPLGAGGVVAGGARGFIRWRPRDPIVELMGLPLRAGSATLLGRHPKSTALYATRYGRNSVFRADLADGVLTTLPREYALPDAKLGSPPAVMSRHNRLAVAGQYHVDVLDLDEAGNPRAEAMRIPVLSALGRAMVYSEVFDRLYLGVELSK